MGGNVINKFSHPKTCNDVNEVRMTTKHDDIEESSPLARVLLGAKKALFMLLIILVSSYHENPENDENNEPEEIGAAANSQGIWPLIGLGFKASHYSAAIMFVVMNFILLILKGFLFVLRCKHVR